MTTTQTGSGNNKYNQYPYYLKFASVLVGLIAFVYILTVLSDPLVALLFSALFSILLHPLCSRFEKWRIPRILSIVLSIIIFFAVLAGLGWLVIIQVSSFGDALPNFATKAETFIETIIAWIEQNFAVSRNQQVSEGKKYLLSMLGESRNVMAQTVVSAGGLLGTAALVPLYVFFFLLYRDFFRQFIYKAFKGISNTRLDRILDKIYDVIQSYMSGLVLVIGIVGILNTIGLWALGVEYAVFFGFLAAFLILIPYIGIFIGSLLPAIYHLISNDTPWVSLGIIGVMSFVQFLEGNFITPNIVGSKVSINPLSAIVMLLLGGKMWGLAGLILALPVTAIAKVILDSNPDLEPFGYLLGEPEKELKEEQNRIAQREHTEEARVQKKRRYGNKRRKPGPPKADQTENGGVQKQDAPKKSPEA